jgi:Uma2 family endonuclease
MTFVEFEQLPDEVCRRHELRHGELVEVPEPNGWRKPGPRTISTALQTW